MKTNVALDIKAGKEKDGKDNPTNSRKEPN